MAYLTVTTQADVVDAGDGQLSLREAVAQANANPDSDSIKFVLTLEGQTLVLTGGELGITQDLTIDGDRNHDGGQITIDGNANGRVLKVSGPGTDVSLINLALTNGRPSDSDGGGAISISNANLNASGVTIRDSQSGYYSYHEGGAIAASSSNLVIRNSSFVGNTSNYGRGGAISLNDGALVLEGCFFSDNTVGEYGSGGALDSQNSTVSVARSSFIRNTAHFGGGISANGSRITINDSTVANNAAVESYGYDGSAGGIANMGSSRLVVRNSTITGNRAGYNGGGLGAWATTILDNTIIAGNTSERGATGGPDVFGVITLSNGHNVFGTDILGNADGDRELASASTIFAAIDPVTGGGQLSPTGIVPLRKTLLSNPALSGADPVTASSFGQLGTTARPLPAGSLPDIGPVEVDQKLSTSPTVGNDILTGNSSANNLSGLAGNDLIKGLGGTDTLNGSDGSDVLDGGPGNDKLIGGNGMDIATFSGTTGVVVDLSVTPATAKRGSEIDTLTSIEGAIGSTKADTFKGNSQANEFQGGLGKDTFTGAGGRNIYDFSNVADSPVGTTRDIIKDFVHLSDAIDVAGVDADISLPGDQSFRWVGSATLTGAAQLGYYVSGGNTIVRASNDADAVAEIEIQLNGAKVLTEEDFRF